MSRPSIPSKNERPGYSKKTKDEDIETISSIRANLDGLFFRIHRRREAPTDEMLQALALLKEVHEDAMQGKTDEVKQKAAQIRLLKKSFPRRNG